MNVTPKLYAVGMTGGIGSLQIGARAAGFNNLGNIEWRRYYHALDVEGRNTFCSNFPGAWLIRKLYPSLLDKLTGVDLLMGHPECGAYSVLSGANYKGRTADEYANKPSDLPLFTQGVKAIQPKFFVMDNLPRSLVGYTIDDWIQALGDSYYLFPEWVSNYHYGNVQKNRRRFFMIGVRRDIADRLGFVFVPSEHEHDLTLKQVLDTIPDWALNNEPHTRTASLKRGHGIYGPRYMTFDEAAGWFLERCPGQNLEYLAKDGTIKAHIGLLRTYTTFSHVIHGGWPTFHPLTGLPLSIRERAAIQGVPHDFVFYGAHIEEDGTWNHTRNPALVKQTGKCMPVQFATYVSQQIAGALCGSPPKPEDTIRVVKPNTYVNSAKRRWCERHGYGMIQELACRACWLANECEKRR